MSSPLETLRAEMRASLARVEGDLADWKRRRDPGERPLTDEGEVALAAFLGGVQRRLDALELPAATVAPEAEVPSPEAVADPESRRKVLAVLQSSRGHFLQPGTIAAEAGIDRKVVRVIAQEMAAEGVLVREVRQFGPVYAVREEAARKPGAVTIATRKHDGERAWIAEVPGHSEAWEPGATENEAIGALVNANPELFGVVVRRGTP